MKWIIICIGLLTVKASPGIAQNRSAVPKLTAGTYSIYLADRKILSDEYEVTAVDKAVDKLTAVDSGGEQKIEIGKSATPPTLFSYRKSINGVVELKAVVEKDYIWFYDREAKVGALSIEPYLMFFDPTAYAGYTLLVRSYDAAIGGKQAFAVIVPAMQDYCEIDIERHGSDQFTAGEKSVSAAHYRMTLGRRETVNLWVDNDRVIAINLSVKGLIAVDASYPDLIKEIRRITSKSL